MWRVKTLFTDVQVQEYVADIDTFAQCWQAFGWKPTVWVHWVVAHSAFFVKRYKNLYLFSSIPTEFRHQRFKRDLRQACHAWKVRNPAASDHGLKHVVELDALDAGLRLRN